ncbi:MULTISPECIES: hypothetical protein [Microbacterium]|uniref:Uncharacterized protein n=1 Tax=Microbacterium hominis TaxID=162426 RepID=A0A2K9DA24_9MICO|nr:MULTISPECIES: hypothetical protein [Microbacterium]AUG29001.1 hypothetical protein CXR34_05625 [Microbacterium hominis]
MRRVLSLQAAQALFKTVPRILIFVGIWLAFYLFTILTEQFVPWWVFPILGIGIFGFVVYLGSVWLDRDITRGAQRDAGDD